jgi:hypothetical protein
MDKKGRFVSTTDEEIEQKRLKMNAHKTIKQNIAAATLLREYLKEKHLDTAFEHYNPQQLDECLAHVFMDVKKSEKERYKITLQSCRRYSLNRYLKAPPYNKKNDIVKEASFANSTDNFKAAIAELKMMGLGDVEHYPSITETDRRKLYTSLYLSPKTPLGLQNKVQFDIRFYFCRRGNENMPQMHKSTCMVKKDSKAGLKYIMKTIDELTKNHRADDKENTSAIMPDNPGSEFSPVLSYEKYVSKLNPTCEKLWEQPKDEFCDHDHIWYNNVPVREKTPGRFMSVFCQKCDLSTMMTQFGWDNFDAEHYK